MSKKIKGITIAFDGDTTGLTQALKKVDSETKSVQSELKQVGNLLKFDPSNVELLAQKQQLLGGAIDSTSKRLDVLKQAQAQVEQQFKNGEIGEEAFRKFQREIIATEGKLNAFKKQADNLKLKIEAQADISGIDKMKTALKELGPTAKAAAKEVGSALGNAGAAAAAGVGALVAGSTDLNNDLARLRTNAQVAGNDLGLVEDAFKKVAAVTGETDSAVETVSNLLASGFKDVELQSIIEGINGAAIKFSDTLKTEGIADGIQETFATGEAVGSFAELLERSGVDLDNFNARLAEASKTGQETNFVIDELANLGLVDLSKSYKESNPELVKNNEATLELQTALSDLAIVLTPVITVIAALITRLIEWATENPQVASTIAVIAGAITAISGAITILSPIITAIISVFGLFGGAAGTAGGSVGILGTIISALSGPIGVAILAIVGIVTALVTAYNESESFREGVTEVFDKFKTLVTDIFTVVKDTIMNFINEALEFAKDIFEKFRLFWEENGEQIKTIVSNVFENIKTTIETVLGVIRGIFEIVFPIIKGVVSTAFNAIKFVISTVIDVVLGIIETALALLRGDWGAAFDALLGIVKDIFDNVKKTFKDLDLFEIGKDILNGLIDGITSVASSVYKKAEEIAGKVIDTFSGIFEINSPSKVLRRQGLSLGEGLEQGIDRSQSRVIESSANLANAALNAFSVLNRNAGAKLGHTANNTSINNSRSFSPVVNVYTNDSGADAMDRTLRRLALKYT